MELTVFITLLLMMFVPISATDSSVISLGSYLVAGPNSTTTSWKSNSGEFAFGFQQVSAEGYLLAIVFDKITPNKTIVWSANRNYLADRGSKVELSADGSQFVLVNSKHQIIWSANTSGSGVAHGAMLDNGNFVLARDESTVLWQSFDEPTDTLLPGQVLDQGGSLLASFSETNQSIGRFRFILQGDGNLVLYTINYPLANSVYGAYWSTQTFNDSRVHFQVIFNQSGKIYLESSNGTVLYNISSNNEVSTARFHQRLTLDYDGVLRHYSYPKSSVGSTESYNWSVQTSEPSNICLRVVGARGAGACGFNSLCFQGTDDRPTCRCPEGFSAVDPTDRMGGCKPDFIRPGCNFKNSSDFELHEVASGDWPGSDYDYFESVDEEWCRRACIADCFCDAAVYRGGSCWKMGMPLRNGRIGDTGGKSFLKVPRQN